MESVRFWDGDEWQRYCMALLFTRHGPAEVQAVPDRHRGDLGMEAYGLDGCAYQCYAAEEPLGSDELYRHQRDKLTRDLGKLESKKLEIAKMLGTVVIRRYIFMVPRHDSYFLLQHASVKSAELRSKGLSFISSEFEIVVCDDTPYAAERDKIFSAPKELLDVDNSVDDASRNDWLSDNDSMVFAARAKLAMTMVNPDRVADALRTVVDQHLVSENAMAALRLSYPEQWKAAKRTVAVKESRLPLEFAGIGSESAMDTLRAIAAELSVLLRRDSGAIDPALSELLAWGAVADWLLRCPLDFVDSGR